MKIEMLDTGILYRNPKPHVRSRQAYFPSVARLADGALAATVVIGEAFEAADLHTHAFRSEDEGRTWTHLGRLPTETPGRLTSDCARLTALPDGRLVAFLIRHDRDAHPGEGLTNPATLGFVPTELLLSFSSDRGTTWTPPRPIEPPLTGPAFEMCSPITVLRDGRWVLPTLTWPGWDGDCPNGIGMIALVSRDGGVTWPDYLEVMRDSADRIYYWESKIVEFADGRLLAVAWAYDAAARRDLPNRFAFSTDGGATWSAPASTGLRGQTLTPAVLDAERVLCVYRRLDRPGLWAVVARVVGNCWRPEAELPLWGVSSAGRTETSEDMVHNFNVLRFGAPCITKLPGGRFLVAFWGYEDCVSVIRRFTLRVVD